MSQDTRPDPYASDEDWLAAGFPVPASKADYRVKSVKVVGPLTLWVEHKDGAKGHVHFELEHLTGVFEPLKDPAFFKQVYLDLGAVTWSDEVDLAPDNMHRHIAAFGEWVLS